MDALQLDYQQRIRSVVAKHPVFSGLTDADIADLTSRMTTKRVAGGDVVVEQGQSVEGIYFIAMGRVRLAITGENRRAVTLAVLQAGDLFGEVSAFDGGPSAATAVALYPSTLLVLRREDLERHVAAHPELAMRMLGQMSRRLRSADETIAELALCDVPERILRRLCALAQKEGVAGAQGLIIRRPPTHQDLANMVGSCRETVCRTISTLMRQGMLIAQGKELVVVYRLVPGYQRPRQQLVAGAA